MKDIRQYLTTMKKQLYAAMLFHQQVLSEKNVQNSKITIGNHENCDFVVKLDDYTNPFTIFDHGKLNLKKGMVASLSVNGKTWAVGENREPKSTTDGVVVARIGNHGHLVGIDGMVVTARKCSLDTDIVGVKRGIQNAVDHRNILVVGIEFDIGCASVEGSQTSQKRDG